MDINTPVPVGIATTEELENFNKNWHSYKLDKYGNKSNMRKGDPLKLIDLPFVLNMNGTIFKKQNLSNFKC